MVDFRLYLITDRKCVDGESLIDRVDRLVSHGVRAVQLREKDLTAREILALANELAQSMHKTGARLFVNDRIDLGLAANADGIQLPEHSWSVREAKSVAPSMLIAKSTHSLESALRAEAEGADFITYGPVFDTASKRIYGKPTGLAALREVTEAVTIPVFALGGITVAGAETCLSHGAFGVALISDLLALPEPLRRLEEYRTLGLV